jgi:hypothetical protein
MIPVKRGEKTDRQIMGRSTTAEITGELDVPNSHFMLPAHIQGGGVESSHLTAFILLVY